MAKWFFFLGLLILSFLYGALSVTFHFFPYKYFEEIRIAWEAYHSTIKEEVFNRKPVQFEFIEKSKLSKPTVLLNTYNNAKDNSEYILMTGGPNQYLDYCPKYGCLAWIMDRTGKIYHVWKVNSAKVWEDIKRVKGYTRPDNYYPAGLHLFPNGDLLVIYQGRNTYPYAIGIAMFDKDSNLLWKKETFSHHWLCVDKKGYIYVPSLKLQDSPYYVGGTKAKIVCKSKKIYKDSIIVLKRDGTIVKEFSINDILIKNGYLGLLYEGNKSSNPEYECCDPLHLNDIRIVPSYVAKTYPWLKEGDILVSLRNPNTLFIFDRVTQKIKWICSGLTILQHSPRFLGKDLIVLDNLGGNKEKGGSRIVEINLSTKSPKTLFPLSLSHVSDFFTHNGGHIDVNPDGHRILVSLTRQGRVVEVDLKNNKVLWEYVNVHEITTYLSKKSRKSHKHVYGRFSVSGAYYVINPKFKFNLLDAKRRVTHE